MLLDEPTTGLDPQARHLVWERLYRLKQTGVDARAHDALHGRSRAAVRPARHHGPAAASSPKASPRDLIDEHVTREVVEVRFEAGADADGRARRSCATLADRVEPLADRVVLYADDGDGIAADDRRGRDAARPSVLVRRASLEDVFLILTGRTLEEA